MSTKAIYRRNDNGFHSLTYIQRREGYRVALSREKYGTVSESFSEGREGETRGDVGRRDGGI